LDVFYVGDDNIGKFVVFGCLFDLGFDLLGLVSKSFLLDFNDKMFVVV